MTPEELVRQALADMNLFSKQPCFQHSAGGDDAQCAGIGAGGGKFACGNIRHTALNNGKLRSQQLA